MNRALPSPCVPFFDRCTSLSLSLSLSLSTFPPTTSAYAIFPSHLIPVEAQLKLEQRASSHIVTHVTLFSSPSRPAHSGRVLDEMQKQCSCAAMFPSYVNIATHSTNPRVKSLLLLRMDKHVREVFLDKPSVVARQVVPMTARLLREQGQGKGGGKSQDVRAANARLTRTLKELMGEGRGAKGRR